jgi:diadenosine tetraphosphate (Ap4A) HIT family hydrolase
MSDQLHAFDCDFCTHLVADPASTRRHLANRVVAAYQKMLLVADYAPMTLGHLLLIPRDHHTGMASFIDRDPNTLTTLRDVTRRYRSTFGGCTVIEHGSGGTASAKGPCIDHAHWHLLPYNDELTSIVDRDHGGSMTHVSSLVEFARSYARADYILCWDAAGTRVALPDAASRRPQYARSVVARHLDVSAMPHEWDWALRADDDLLVRTLAVARAAFAGGTENNDDSTAREIA